MECGHGFLNHFSSLRQFRLRCLPRIIIVIAVSCGINIDKAISQPPRRNVIDESM